MRCSARVHTHVEHGLTMEHGFLRALVVREATISARSALAVGSPQRGLYFKNSFFAICVYMGHNGPQWPTMAHNAQVRGPVK